MPESTSSSERTLKIVVEYDGTNLCGWQRQDNGPTVQGHLEIALRSMTHEETAVAGASRTDAGVHAEAQVAIFTTTRRISCFGFRRGLNSVLPKAISVRSVEEVDSEFHPRFDARGKHYRYTVLNRSAPGPLTRRQAWHRAELLDLDLMREAADVLIGEHDFSSFRASGCGAKTATRRIDKIVVAKVGDMVTIEVWGNAFLRNMVRIIAGSLVEAGHGNLSATELTRVLVACDRRQAGPTAPAQGLCLVEVFFPTSGATNQLVP